MGIHPSDVTAVLITRGDQPEWQAEREKQFERLGMDYIIVKSPDILTRYTTAERHAQTTAVFFQDDDVNLPDETILALCDLYEPGILVTSMFDAWIEAQGYFDLALVGLGGICDVGLWKDAFRRWFDAYGNGSGDAMHRLRWDADFIFGTLAKWRRFDLGGEEHIDMDVATGEGRLATTPGQHERKFETIDMTRKLRTVVLTMLVKNEAENIERALSSNVEWWDTLLLYDTGSEDATGQIAYDFCVEHEKRFVLLQGEFDNFKDARTRMLQRARQEGDYQLLMDADEEWIWDGAESRERPLLWAECYMLHYDGSVDWAQPRIIASRYPWKWEGATHSYLSWDGEAETLALNMQWPRIVHHGDERSGARHGERDIEILRRELAEGNDPWRNYFLLGKCYDGMGMFDEAIDAYSQRIALDQPDEEDYWCRLRRGVLMAEHQNDFVGAVDELMAAYVSRPTRIEALRAVAFYCTAVADATPYPEDDITLVLRNSYRV